jgi:hypothetical protein
LNHWVLTCHPQSRVPGTALRPARIQPVPLWPRLRLPPSDCCLRHRSELLQPWLH